LLDEALPVDALLGAGEAAQLDAEELMRLVGS
jgi:hypothetical protein